VSGVRQPMVGASRLAGLQRLGYNPRAFVPAFVAPFRNLIVKQLFAVVALFAAVFALAERVPPGTTDEIRARTQPFGELCKAGEACGQATVAVSGGAARTGETVYNQFCFACHASGVGGAPILGNAEQWAPRLAKGDDAIWASVTKGLNAMPPKGTCMNCSDEELKAAIAYMSK
jgi:cytochrome c5